VTTAVLPLGSLAFRVSVTAHELALILIGDVDVVTAPELGAVLTSLLERSQDAVVVDLAETTFLGVAGLRTIRSTAARLAASGRLLSIRSPSPQVGRMLALTGLTDIVSIVDGDRGSSRRGPEQAVVAAAAGSDVTPPQGHTAAIPTDLDVVDGALRLVVTVARATVGGADGVSVSLHRHGRLRTVAATDQTVLDMDAEQYAAGEGPCVDASVEGHRFHATALDREARWPAFTPRARTLGINAILSAPIMAEGRPVGALNIYSRTPAAFAGRDQELASVIAAETSVLLEAVGVDASDEPPSRWLARALRTRLRIAQAQGVLMEREGIGEDDAYTMLRCHSQVTRQPLRERAADVAGSTRHPPRPSEPDDKGQPWLAS